MTNDLTTLDFSGKLPAAFSKAIEQSADDLKHGVTTGFPVISFRGKVWRLRKGDDQRIFGGEDTPSSSIDVVMVLANKNLSKIYYAQKYEEGDDSPPSCWSMDGIHPDSGASDPQSKACANCPNNVWGSRISEAGKKVKACSDSRRVAVVLPSDLERNKDKATSMLVRIPGASLAGLREYAEKQLHGFPYFAVVTKIGFDINASYPKLTFRPVSMIEDEDVAAAITALRENPDVIRMVTTGDEIDPADVPEPAPAPSKVTPIKAAPEPEPEPVAEKKKAAPKKETTVKKEAPVVKDDSVDAMLDNLLGGL